MRIFTAAKASFVFIKKRCKSSHCETFFKIGVLKNFCNIHRKTLVLESLFNKGAGLQVLSCEYCEFFKSRCFILRFIFKDVHT